MNSSKSIGYVGGVFDLFHFGHVRILREARRRCDYLVVGVSTDELSTYKGKVPVMSFTERLEVVECCRSVDQVVVQETLDKIDLWQQIGFDKLFVGTDWLGSESWRTYERFFADKNVEVTYLPYTESISSTIIRDRMVARE